MGLFIGRTINYYFNSKIIEPKVLRYISLYNIDRPAAMEIFSELTPDFINVIKGVMFTHRYQIFNTVDDLISISIEAFLTSLHRYDPTYKGLGKPENRLFSYLSLVSSRAMYFYNIKDLKKKRDYIEVELTDDVMENRNFTRNTNEVYGIIEGIDFNLKKNYLPIRKIFLEHISMGVFNKTEFTYEVENYIILNRCCGHSMRPHNKAQSIVRIFLNVITPIIKNHLR
jgi:hypothetical protein